MDQQSKSAEINSLSEALLKSYTNSKKYTFIMIIMK